MRELEVTQAVVAAVVDKAGRHARVRTVRLRIGRDAGVVPDAVRFCFDSVAEGTPAAGARLVIDESRGTAECQSCGAGFDLDDLLLGCDCGSLDVQVAGSDELVVTGVEVA
jgi:hydrogenase nickel incorporation protein HypA/HybF